MTSFYDLRNFFSELGYNTIIAADAETRTHERRKGKITEKVPAGGVSVALESIAVAAKALYIARGRTEADEEVVDNSGKLQIETHDGAYILKRLFFTEEEVEDYYFGFANQTLWPLCHAAFEKPLFHKKWYAGYRDVNKKYAEAIQREIKDKTFVWVQDYQLALVPLFLKRQKDTVISMFWHIPWPTWEQFRILPQKKELLESLLHCDFLAFHRGYQARNFIDCVRRELEVRVDEETKTIFFEDHKVVVTDLSLGIDTDTIKEMGTPKDTFVWETVRRALGMDEEQKEEKASAPDPIVQNFQKYQVILGVDRLDYTKGLPQRLRALDRFFELHSEYKGKAIYLGIMAPSRDKIPSYKQLRNEVEKLAHEINEKYHQKEWQPLHMVYEAFTREDVIEFFKRARVCLVTPLDDGMNLVSKEMVVAASTAENPGMLVLSQFAGSAIDLTAAVIINPYDADETAQAVYEALKMPVEEKKERIQTMVERLDEHNIYAWAQNFVQRACDAARDNRQRG